MRGYTNAAGGGTLASIAFDREAFAEYLEQLGSINDVRDRLQDFLDSVAYSFSSGTITADKFVTDGNNLIPRLDSFEDETGKSVLMFPNNLGMINAAIPVVSSDPYYPAPHGSTVLKLTTPSSGNPFTFFLNPYNADDSAWITLGKMDYWFSYYLYTTSTLAVTGTIQLLNESNVVVSSVPFSISQAGGWTRFSNNFTLGAKSKVKFRITINETSRSLYLDAIQIEYKYITTLAPTAFSLGGKVVIEGGNIRANSISASDAIFQDAAIVDANIANINAAKIDAGIINTNVVTVGDYDRGLMTMFNNNISFYEPVDETTQNKRVSIGKLNEAGTVWGLEVRGSDGTSVLFDHNGLTSLGTTDGLTKAAYIDENLEIYGSKLRAGSIDASVKIAANSIVANNIAAGAITTDTLAANAITADKITAETINGTHLNSTIVTSKTILLGDTAVRAGIYGGGTTDSNVRFWAGDTFENREIAPFRVTQDGRLFATGANIIEGYSTSTEVQNAIINAINEANSYADALAADLETQIDGRMTTWFYPVEPTLLNEPAVNWVTIEDKNTHLGDLYYDTVTGYSYRFAYVAPDYYWLRITDSDVTQALADAARAQDTADSKRRVFTTQPVPPYDVGDLWVQGTSGDIMRCSFTRGTGAYNASDWVKASKYTDDTVANTKAPAVITSNTAPVSPVVGQQWIDTSLTPPMMKVWNGTTWIFTNYTSSQFQTEVNSLSLAVAQAQISSTVTPTLQAHETRITNAETKITPTAITSTVRSSTEYINDLGGKYNVSQASILEQTVDGLTLTVQDYSDGKLTGVKYTFDGTGATFLGGGLKIKNNAGTDVFYADVNGNLTFSGALSGATGTFSGSLSAATGTFSGQLTAATGSFSGTLSASTITGSTISGGSLTGSAINGGSITINNSFKVSSTGYTEITNNIGFFSMGGATSYHPLLSGLNIAQENGISFRSGSSVGSPGSEAGTLKLNAGYLQFKGNTVLTTASTASDTVKGPIKMWLGGTGNTTLYIQE